MKFDKTNIKKIIIMIVVIIVVAIILLWLIPMVTQGLGITEPSWITRDAMNQPKTADKFIGMYGKCYATYELDPNSTAMHHTHGAYHKTGCVIFSYSLAELHNGINRGTYCDKDVC